MGPSRYDHLVFDFQPGRRSQCAAAVMTEKDHRGNALTRINSRLHSDINGLRARPMHATYACFYHTPAAADQPRDGAQESFRVISTARLRTLPPVHLPPIDVVVCNDPIWRSHLEVGFVLRCFQHLSVPDAATRPCPWRDNRLAGGRSNTVLSY